MRRVLQSVSEHWQIIEAEDGVQAVAKAQESKPDLVILDLVMPRADGLTAAREISRLFPEVPILMHTLYSSLEVEVEAGFVGVRRVLPKSESKILISAVQEVLHCTPPAISAPDSETATSDVVPLNRRQEDKIRDLSAQLFALEDKEGHSPLISELRDALHQHIEQLRARIADYPVVERRVRNLIALSPPAAPQSDGKDSGPISNSVPIAAVLPEKPEPTVPAALDPGPPKTPAA